jgi:hypothetical protein
MWKRANFWNWSDASMVGNLPITADWRQIGRRWQRATMGVEAPFQGPSRTAIIHSVLPKAFVSRHKSIDM